MLVSMQVAILQNVQIGFGRITTIKTVETRDKNKDVGMKKTQKQDIIQNGRIKFYIPQAMIHNACDL